MQVPKPAARSRAWVERLAATECPALTARRARRAERSGAPQDPIVWTRARGVNVWDADDNRYVDLSAGFGAAVLGHCAPPVRAAIERQSGRLLHALGDLHPSDVKVELLERLCALAPWPNARAMLGLSGGDAVSAALKTAALATGRPGVLAFEGAYHGLEYGPLASCGYDARFRVPFAAQLNPHVVFAPYPDAAVALEAALAAVEERLEPHIGAVLVEPVLGRGGMVVPPAGFLSALCARCARRGVLVIADEVMTGVGRAGALALSRAADPAPDLVCLGKGLGGELPVSACLGRAEVMAAWGDPDSEALHTGTFFGNPLGCAAACATLEAIERDALSERAQQLGQWLQLQLTGALRGRVRAVRGQGLMIGIEFDRPALGLSLMQALLRRGYITVPARADAAVLSLTPPLTIAQPLLAEFVTVVGAALDEVSA